MEIRELLKQTPTDSRVFLAGQRLEEKLNLPGSREMGS